MKRRWFGTLIAALVAAIGTAVAVYWRVIRPWHVRWGATDDEVNRAWPGDDLVPAPRVNATHAITIQAPADKVWPWIAQLGQGRGGFYSFESVENAMGADIHNTDRILPEFQNPQVGAILPLAEGGFGLPIAAVEPGKTLVLHGDTRDGMNIPELPLKPGDFLNVVWSFHVAPVDARTSRLVERWCMDWNPNPQSSFFIRAFLEPGAFVMQWKMLNGIKARAERLAGEVQA